MISRIFFVISISLCVALAFSPTINAAQYFFMENDIVGQPAPDFTLRTTGGENLSLAKFRDTKKAIIFFWATWCPSCRKTLLKIDKRMSELEMKNIRLALIDVGENEDVVKKFLKKNKLDFDVFIDEKETLAESYGIYGVPTFVFVNDSGIVKEVLHALPKNLEEVFEDTKS